MKRRIAIAIVWLVFVGIGLSKLRLDVQVLNLLPTDIPSVEALKLYEEHFGKADELIITLRGSDSDALEKSAKSLAGTLRSHTNLVRQAQWQAPWLENPSETGELLAYMWVNAKPEAVEQLAARLTLTNLPIVLEELKVALATTMSPQEMMMQSYDPLGLSKVGSSGSALEQAGAGRSFFASEDGTFRLLFVQSARPLTTFPECRDWIAAVQTVVTNWNDGQVETIGYTGRPAFVSEISGGMEGDVSGSVGGTAVMIAILFWLAHRSYKPLFLLMFALGVVLVSMLALGGLLFGSLNVVSLGFAAILLGLGVDYGLLIYQERVAVPGGSAADLRKNTQPGIFWSAVTTSGAFALLNFAGLPGLSQLGSLIAIGVIVAAAVMLHLYLPGVMKLTPRVTTPKSRASLAVRPGLIMTLVLFCLGALALARGLPRMDTGTEALRPRDTPAYDAMEAVKTNITGRTDPFWLLTKGQTQQEVAANLGRIENRLITAREAGVIQRFDLPTTVFPNLENEKVNRLLIRAIFKSADQIRTVLLANGFDETSWALAGHVFAVWGQALASNAPFTPTSNLSHWVLDRTISVKPGMAMALGSIEPLARGPEWQRLKREIQGQGGLIAGWDELGHDLFARVRGRVPLVLGAIVLLSIVCLWKAFGTFREVLLGLITLLFALWCLLAVMKLANWSWNLMNMVAIPLLIGAGVDYTIHVQLALKREHGSLQEMWRKVGRALLLSAGTTIAGFGSLAWAGNAGLASLGMICAIGLTLICFTSVWLLPVWWLALVGKGAAARE